MCCGSKKTALPAQQQSKTSRSSRAVAQSLAPDIIVGAEGMTTLEYQLTKAGPTVYRGAVTGQTYVFGGRHKLCNVDNRDVPALLSRIEDRRHAFALATIETNAPAPMPTPEKKLETVPIKEEVLPEPMPEIEPVQVKTIKRKAKIA